MYEAFEKIIEKIDDDGDDHTAPNHVEKCIAF